MKQDNDNNDETPIDIRSITTTGFCAGRISTNLFSGEIDSRESEETDFGVQIHRDGREIALSAGTTWSPDDSPEMMTFHSLSPEQAREIGESLINVADDVDEMDKSTEDGESTSLIRRLLP